MLYLPPGQGFSIYSLAARAAAPCRQAARRRIRTTGCRPTPRSPVPIPNCPTRFRITRTGKRRFSHARDDRRRRSANGRADAGRALQPSPRLRDLARHPRRLAARRRPRAGRPQGGRGRSRRLLRGRHHHLRLRRHLYRRRGADRRFPRELCAPPRRRSAAADSRSTPNSCPISTVLPVITKRACARTIDRSLRRLAVRAARPRAVPLVGLRRSGLRRGGAVARGAAAAKARSI